MDDYLRSQWRRIVPEADDNLLGGESDIDAIVALMTQLQLAGFGVTMRDLMRFPTVPLLAEVLRERSLGTAGGYPTLAEVWADADSVWSAPVHPPVHLAPGSGTPLFFVHTGLGQVRFVERAVDHFRDGRPVYGFEAPGLRDHRRPPLSMEGFADQYIAQMRMVQPRGPYWIGGFCMGSHLAFEMAHRLDAVGESVAWLGLLPAAFWMHEGPNSIRPGIRQRPAGIGPADLYLERLNNLQLLFGDLDLDANRAEALDVLEQSFNLDGVKPDAFFWHAAVTAAASFAQETYDPRPYPGSALVFQPKRALSGEVSDWSPVAPNARTIVLDVTDSLEIMKTPEFRHTIAPR